MESVDLRTTWVQINLGTVWAQLIDLGLVSEPLVPVDDGLLADFAGDANTIPSWVDTSDWNTEGIIEHDALKTISAAHRLVRNAATGETIKKALRNTEDYVENYFR